MTVHSEVNVAAVPDALQVMNRGSKPRVTPRSEGSSEVSTVHPVWCVGHRRSLYLRVSGLAGCSHSQNMTNFLHMSARWPKLAAKVFELEHAQRLADLVCKRRRIGDTNGGNLPGFPLPELVAPPLLPAVGNYDLISGDSSDDGKEMVPEGLSSRFVSGPRLLTERLLTEDEEQWTVMTLHKLIEHTPSNYSELELSDRPCLFRGVRVQWLFVVPLFQENLRVDLAMAETVWDLLFCTNSVTRSKALLDAGIMVPDNAGTRYSMRGARSFFQAVAAVLVLASGDVLCHCLDFMVRHECVHQYYVKYLRVEGGMHDFTSMASLTRGCSLLMSGFVCVMIVWKTTEQ